MSLGEELSKEIINFLMKYGAIKYYLRKKGRNPWLLFCDKFNVWRVGQGTNINFYRRIWMSAKNVKKLLQPPTA